MKIWEKKCFLPKFTFSGPISFRYQCIVVYFRRLDYEENMENARYATNDETPL